MRVKPNHNNNASVYGLLAPIVFIYLLELKPKHFRQSNVRQFQRVLAKTEKGKKHPKKKKKKETSGKTFCKWQNKIIERKDATYFGLADYNSAQNSKWLRKI